MTIFSAFPRADSTPASHGESHAQFLDRVSGPYWDQVRDLIEDWFSRLCPDAQADVRGRLRSKDDRQSKGAIWQHGEESSFRLGSLSHRGRAWLRVMIYVPDTVEGEEESVAFFRETLDQVAIAVEARLQRRRPEWPIDELVAQVRQLKPAA